MHEVICPQLDLIVVDRTRTSIVVVEIYRKITQTEKLTSWLGTWRCFISANKFIRSAIYGIWIDARHLGIANRSRPVRLLFSFWKNHNTYVLCRNDEETPEGCDANKSSEEEDTTTGDSNGQSNLVVPGIDCRATALYDSKSRAFLCRYFQPSIIEPGHPPLQKSAKWRRYPKRLEGQRTMAKVTVAEFFEIRSWTPVRMHRALHF